MKFERGYGLPYGHTPGENSGVAGTIWLGDGGIITTQVTVTNLDTDDTQSVVVGDVVEGGRRIGDFLNATACAMHQVEL